MEVPMSETEAKCNIMVKYFDADPDGHQHGN
jgi:hypothetical protein